MYQCCFFLLASFHCFLFSLLNYSSLRNCHLFIPLPCSSASTFFLMLFSPSISRIIEILLLKGRQDQKLLNFSSSILYTKKLGLKILANKQCFKVEISSAKHQPLNSILNNLVAFFPVIARHSINSIFFALVSSINLKVYLKIVLEQSADYLQAPQKILVQQFRMKRSGPQLYEPLTRKRVFTYCQKTEELPFKLRLLRNWKLTPEISRFLKSRKELEGSFLKDNTSDPHLAVVPYKPGVYQQIKEFFNVEELAKHLESSSAMDIE